MFDQALQSVMGIKQLEPQIMTQIFWSQVNDFSTPHSFEPHIVALRDRLHRAIAHALVPLREYLAAYDEHVAILQLDIESHVKAIETDDDMTLSMVLEHIEKAKEALQHAQRTLPTGVTIGFAKITTKKVRDVIVDLRSKLLQQLKDLVAMIPRRMMQEATKGFEAINRQLKIATTTIEDVAKMRKYIDDLPVAVAELTTAMEASQEWYQALEDMR